LTLRSRILLIVLALGTIPPLLVGLWLTRSTSRTSEALVQDGIREGLEEVVPTIVSRWTGLRTGLLDLADHPAVQRALSASPLPGQHDPSADPPLRWDLPGVLSVRFTDLDGRDVQVPSLSLPARPPTVEGPTLPGAFTVFDRADGRPLGTLHSRIDPSSLLVEGPLMLPGGVVGLFDASTGRSLLPRAFDRPLLAEDRFSWAGDLWVSQRVDLEDPDITVAVAAPLTPFTRPFDEAAGRATLVLLTVAGMGLLLAAMITRNVTRSMRDLAEAAEAVAEGDLNRRIEIPGNDEVGRAARAFNTMTESLRSTLSQLAHRESLAAMGDFAASLAHEVRNPLTAIRIDLERVEEGLPEDSPLLKPHRRALREIGRLDDTVSGALDGVRKPQGPGVCNLEEVLGAAAEAAGPDLEAAGATLRIQPSDEDLHVRGEPGSLEQLLLNLLRNAAQALDGGGTVTVRSATSGESVVVEIRDSGPGIQEEDLHRLFEPLFSTRPTGTGLGLTISRRIAEDHGGTLELENHPDGGAIARLRVPRWAPPAV
jgi:signal transduction histidine kinase